MHCVRRGLKTTGTKITLGPARGVSKVKGELAQQWSPSGTSSSGGGGWVPNDGKAKKEQQYIIADMPATISHTSAAQ